MDLKEGLKNLTENKVVKIDLEEKVEEQLTFEKFKRLIGDKILNDKIITQMKVKWFEDATQMIVFQGVQSNVIARFRSNGQHVINRSAFKKRVQDILEYDLEPSEEQRKATERTKKKPISEDQ